MRIFNLIFFYLFLSLTSIAQKSNISVIAYYAGSATMLDSFPIEKITHLIFSFGHLKGDSMFINNARDSNTIKNMVALKQRNPKMKVMLSMGGWSACATCSEVFSHKSKRKVFAKTVKELCDYFTVDGIDLDWEYPATEGYPGHRFEYSDRKHFTKLVKDLRDALGKDAEISFAAGGLKNQLDSSFEWNKVMKMVNRVNLMSYDLISGYDTVSGHHTALYSTSKEEPSVDFGVKYLLKLGVPANKIAIGAAFYARIFANTTDANRGLYQPTIFYKGVSFKSFDTTFTQQKGYQSYWDSTAKAPYMYNVAQKYFVSFDDSASIHLKTKYAMDKNLNGIMFWQLADDSFTNGLLDVIDKTKYRVIGGKK